jgi:tetratricopeptide (TPR) repeat protein
MTRPPSHAARLLALCALLVLGAGCRTVRRAASPDLAWLRGRAVLVVADQEGEAAGAREAAVTRALSTVPVRAWPADAEPALQDALADPGRGDDRVGRAREAAEQRRIPWLIVAGDEVVRVEEARGGAVKWTSDPRPGMPAGGAATALRDGIGPGEGEEAATPLAQIRLAPPERLEELRTLAVQARWGEHADAVGSMLEQWPADPALLVHSVLPDLLSAEPTGAGLATLRRSVQLNPDGESELLALALAAQAGGRLAFGLRARELLVRTYPERLDYRPELADLHGELGGSGEAVAVLRGGLGGLDREGLDNVPAGTAPHDSPLALPYADVRFSLGWYLAALGDAEGALLSYEKALEIYASMGRPAEQSDAVNNAGVVLVEAGRPAVAVPLFRKARRLRLEQGRLGKAANSMHNLARALADSRRVPEALEAYEEAAREYAELGDELSAIESLFETLEHHAATGDADGLERRADTLLQRLSALDGAIDEVPERQAALRGSIWFARAQGRMKLSDPEGALEAYTVALDVYRRGRRRLDEAQTLYAMAVPNMALFRLEDAYGNLVAALLLAVELGDSASIVDIRAQLGELGALLRSSGRTPPVLPEALTPYME